MAGKVRVGVCLFMAALFSSGGCIRRRPEWLEVRLPHEYLPTEAQLARSIKRARVRGADPEQDGRWWLSQTMWSWAQHYRPLSLGSLTAILDRDSQPVAMVEWGPNRSIEHNVVLLLQGEESGLIAFARFEATYTDWVKGLNCILPRQLPVPPERVAEIRSLLGSEGLASDATDDDRSGTQFFLTYWDSSRRSTTVCANNVLFPWQERTAPTKELRVLARVIDAVLTTYAQALEQTGERVPAHLFPNMPDE